MTLQIKNIVSVMNKKTKNNGFINIVEIQQRNIEGVKLLTEKGKLVQFDKIVLFKLNPFEKFGFCIKSNNIDPQNSVVHLFYTVEESESNSYELTNMKKVFCSNEFNVVEMHKYLLMLNSNLVIEKDFDELKSTLIYILKDNVSEDYFSKVSFNLVDYLNEFKEEKLKVEKYLNAYQFKKNPEGLKKLAALYGRAKENIRAEIGKSPEMKRVAEINKLIEELNVEKAGLLKSVGIIERTKYKNKYEEQYQLLMSHVDEIKKLIIKKDTDYSGKRWKNAIERFENDNEVLSMLEEFGMKIEELLI